MSRHDTQWERVDGHTLRSWPLPLPAGDADKEDRGTVLVVGGSRELGGAAQLAAISALRAGAGKLAIATAASVAAALSPSVPEARVIALAETEHGAFACDSIAQLAPGASELEAALIGPGMMDSAGTTRFVASLLQLVSRVPAVLDALAMDIVGEVKRFEQPVLLTPHAGEMAHLLGIDKREVLADPGQIAARASIQWNAVVALKGATTWVAAPGGGRWRHECSHPGLATSGSGDVLAGLVAGLLARGASLEQACVWGVALHAMAGGALERKVGPLGYLARELSAEVPGLMGRLATSRFRQRALAPRAS